MRHFANPKSRPRIQNRLEIPLSSYTPIRVIELSFSKVPFPPDVMCSLPLEIIQHITDLVSRLSS